MSNRWRLILGLALLVSGLAQMGYLLARYNDPPPQSRGADARASDDGMTVGIIRAASGLIVGAFLIYSSYQSSESVGGRSSRDATESDREPRRGRSWSRGSRKPWHGGSSDD